MGFKALMSEIGSQKLQGFFYSLEPFPETSVCFKFEELIFSLIGKEDLKQWLILKVIRVYLRDFTFFGLF